MQTKYTLQVHLTEVGTRHNECNLFQKNVFATLFASWRFIYWVIFYKPLAIQNV